MSGAVEATTAIPSAAWQQRLANFRIIPRIETYPLITKFAKTAIGKLLILALFALGLRFAMKDWIPMSHGLAVITFVPLQRRILLTILTLVFTFAVPWVKWPHPLYTVSAPCLRHRHRRDALLARQRIASHFHRPASHFCSFERLLAAHRLCGLLSERHSTLLESSGSSQRPSAPTSGSSATPYSIAVLPVAMISLYSWAPIGRFGDRPPLRL